MKAPKQSALLRNFTKIYNASKTSDDGHRCMIAPSPEIREKLKKEFAKLKKLSADSTMGFLIKPTMNTRVGLNDGLLIPGDSFPLGSSVERVRSSLAAKTPLQGKVRVIVVLVDFPDKAISTPKKHFQDLFFSTGVIPTGSVKEYYKEVTNGLVDIDGEVVGPFHLPKKIGVYAHGESGTGTAQPNARTMAQDAAKLANATVDFSKYDNDHDGFVDAYVIVHAGRGAEETANPKDIWSHKWLLPAALPVDNTKVYAYLTIPEDCKLGVCAHELGHLLFGFPDLYDTEAPGEGVGDWCLMGGGSWNGNGDTPAHPSAWCKQKQNWVTVVTQSTNKAGVLIDDVKKSNKVFRLWKDGGPGSEYFLLENRQQAKFDKKLPGGGLLIWHVDDAIADNSNENHYKVALVQADGKKDLELGTNRGDAKDVWTAGKNFTKTSNPNSMSYGSLDTSVQVKNISVSSGVVKADLYVKTGPLMTPVKKTTKKKTAKKSK
jgi:immune inhibitor A